SEWRSGDGQLQPEVTSDRGADIGICFAAADAPGLAPAAEGQDGHLLARVIRSLPGWVAAVVCRDDQEIIGPQYLKKLRQTLIERLERGGIARNVAPVPVFRIEIDEVGEEQTAVGQ